MEIYEKSDNPLAFAPPNVISQEYTKRIGSKVKSNKVYQKYRRVQWKHERCRSLTFGVGTNFQADLATVMNLSRWNKGVKYLLIVVG